MSVRTDLAVESLTAAAAIEPKQRGTYFQITEVTISNAEQAAAVGKPEGHYLTLETAALHRHNPQFPQLAEELGRELRAFFAGKRSGVSCWAGQPEHYTRCSGRIGSRADVCDSSFTACSFRN